MTVKVLGYTWKKKVFYPLVSLLLLILVGAFFVNRYWSPILAERVKSTVLTSTDSLYIADFSDAELHVLQGKLVIKDISIKPNMAVYNRLRQRHVAPNNLYELHVERLVLKHIHPIGLYFGNRLNIGSIEVNRPDLHITYQLNHTHDTLPPDKRTAWQRIKFLLKSIRVNEINLNDIKFRYDDYSGIRLNISQLKEMNITAKDLLIDSASQFDRSRFLYCRDVITELNDYKGLSKNNLYRYAVKSLTFSTLTSQLQVYGFSLLPAQPEVFYRKAMHNRYALYIDTLQANNFDYRNYNKYHVINCSKLLINGGRLNLTSNTAIDSASQKNRLGSFPNVAIHHAHSNFKIDSVEVHHMDIRYDAYSKRSHKAGSISFNRTYGLFLNVTSNPAALNLNNFCNVNLSTWLMNKGRLDIQFKFNLTDSAHSYSYQGKIGPMRLPALNPVLKPLALIEMKSGQLNGVDFSVTGNRTQSTGNLRMLYSNLKVHVLRPDTINDKFKHFTIGSIFANALIVKHNNPDTTGLPARTFKLSYQRPDNAGFFKTMVKTLIPGIKATVGYDAATEKRVKATIVRHKFEKQQRQIKKALRQEKRAQKQRLDRLKNH